MKLYSYWRSTTSYRVRAALNLKGQSYETVPINLVAGDQGEAEYTALNPSKGVPALVLDDGTVLTQSLAILDYLDEIAEPRLLPSEPVRRAHVLAAAHAVALDIHPVNNLRVVKYLKAEHGIDGQGWMQHWMQQGFAAVEAMLPEKFGFAFGEAPDLADLCITAQLYNAHRWGVDLTPYPKLQRIEAACLAVPEIAAARPENQPDAEEMK